jgi:outer membrane lipoprotein-sorting protein
MNRKIFACLLLGALGTLGAAALSAQTVDELIAKNIAARGGREKLKSVQSMRITGKMVMGQGMEAPFTMEMSRPHNVRRDFTFQGMTGSMAYDGKSGWQVMPFMGKKDPEPMSADDLKEIQEEADLDGPLFDYKDKGNQVEYLGKADVEGSPAHKLKLTLKNGDMTTIYLDADSYLEIKEEAKRNMRGQMMDMEETIGNYKQVEGLTVPFTMDQKIKGAPSGQTLTFDKIELNVKVDADRFAMPAVKKEPAPATPPTPPKPPSAG